VARQIFSDAGDRRRLAFVLVSLAELSLERGRLLATEEDLATAMEVAAETGNEPAAIRAQIVKGKLSLLLARPAVARQAFLEAEGRARALGDRRRLADALEGLGLVALRSGYLKQAQTWLDEVRELYARMGDRQRLADALLYLGDVQQGIGHVARALRHFRRAERGYREIGHPEGEAAARFRIGRVFRARGHTTDAIRELAASAEMYGRLGLPEGWLAMRDLGRALADAGSDRLAGVALARADRGEVAGAARRAHRVESRTVRAEMALRRDDVRAARYWARQAAHHARRTTGHGARIAARLAVAEVALHANEPDEAAAAAAEALAFAFEHGDPLAVAAAERTLAELAARRDRMDDAHTHAHRAARAYTGRADAGSGPAKLLHALRRGMRETDPTRSDRYRRAAHRCYARLESQGFRAPDDL
ncbi:MAG: hypothetical protein OER88_12630, partial [Planctomycetota bacterium]|nr:hypothetical protein [Planctomycetota bacterium]